MSHKVDPRPSLKKNEARPKPPFKRQSSKPKREIKSLSLLLSYTPQPDEEARPKLYLWGWAHNCIPLWNPEAYFYT